MAIPERKPAEGEPQTAPQLPPPQATHTMEGHLSQSVALMADMAGYGRTQESTAASTEAIGTRQASFDLNQMVGRSTKIDVEQVQRCSCC